FLERIRRNGFRATLEQIQRRGYANGGPVVPLPRFVPNVPAPSQALLDAAAGPASADPSRGIINLTLPGGDTYTMHAPADQFDRLLANTSRKFGRTHRKG